MHTTLHKSHWNKAIILVDLNAFFASIEQIDCHELRGRPVAVTNGSEGTCIITCSYEARKFGVKTGMRIYEAKKICPHLIQCPSRPERYAQVSAQIMDALNVITPDIEIFSVDEAFLDVTQCQTIYGTPEQIAQQVKLLVYETSGILCSVGVSGDKTTAKYAAKQMKPDGLTIIPPWESEQRLASVPVTELCGIARGIGNYLAKHGVFLCGDMKKIPIEVLTRRFGPLGRRIWFMAQGKDPSPVAQNESAPKSIGHGKVLPPHTNNKTVIQTYLRHMAEKVAARMRHYQLHAQTYFIGLKTHHGWLGDKLKTINPIADGNTIYQLCLSVLEVYWQGETIRQVQVTALDPSSGPIQLDLFTEIDLKAEQRNTLIDAINDKFGNYTIVPAELLNRSSMPNVIAPAWRPHGVRKSV